MCVIFLYFRFSFEYKFKLSGLYFISEKYFIAFRFGFDSAKVIFSVQIRVHLNVWIRIGIYLIFAELCVIIWHPFILSNVKKTRYDTREIKKMSFYLFLFWMSADLYLFVCLSSVCLRSRFVNMHEFLPNDLPYKKLVSHATF